MNTIDTRKLNRFRGAITKVGLDNYVRFPIFFVNGEPLEAVEYTSLEVNIGHEVAVIGTLEVEEDE